MCIYEGHEGKVISERGLQFHYGGWLPSQPQLHAREKCHESAAANEPLNIAHSGAKLSRSLPELAVGFSPADEWTATKTEGRGAVHTRCAVCALPLHCNGLRSRSACLYGAIGDDKPCRCSSWLTLSWAVRQLQREPAGITDRVGLYRDASLSSFVTLAQ